MAPLLRRRLQCFYCGQRAQEYYHAGLAQWQCSSCEAVNHLDEKGEITDPPVAQTSQRNVRFAQQAARSVSPPSSQDPIFCQTCLKNQHLLAQNLADYLPSTDDPRYQEYVDNYATYKRNLEERYPQICRNCEPRARALLRESNNIARSDHVRRLREQTRARVGTRQSFGIYDVAVRIISICWWLGMFGQVLLHLSGVLATTEKELGLVEAPKSLDECFWEIVSTSTVSSACIGRILPACKVSLFLSLVSIWFNPSMLRGSMSRATGLGEYYKLQLVINALRTISWYYLENSSTDEIDPKKLKAIHAIMFAFNLVVPIIAHRTPGYNSRPYVSFQYDDEPLISPETGRALATGSHLTPPSSELAASQNPQFPINSLAAAPVSESPSYPPTPPPEDDQDSDFDDATTIVTTADSDAMDIDTPVKDQFSFPRPRPYKESPKLAQPSPFHGILPNAPISQAHRLRNPPNKPTFQKASESSQRQYFGDLHSGDAADAETSASNFGGLPDNKSSSNKRSYEMAQQRFFGSKSGGDTGLEALFTGIFSLNDEPPELRRQAASDANGATEDNAGQRKNRRLSVSILTQRILGALGTSLALAAWLFAARHPESSIASTCRALPPALAIAVTGQRLAEAFRPTRAVWALSDILILSTELGIAVFLAYGSFVSSELQLQRQQPQQQGDGYENSSPLMPSSGSVNGLPLWYFGTLCVQEAGSLLREVLRNPPFSGSSAALAAAAAAVEGENDAAGVNGYDNDIAATAKPPLRSNGPAAAAASSSNRAQSSSFGSIGSTTPTTTPARNTRSQTKALASSFSGSFSSSFDARRDSPGASGSFAGLNLGLGDSPGSVRSAAAAAAPPQPSSRALRRMPNPWERGAI